jgi:histidyl-tRNA synthetase
MRMPIVEFTELFKRSIGENYTGISSRKGLYNVTNGAALPDPAPGRGTAACVPQCLSIALAGGGQTETLVPSGRCLSRAIRKPLSTDFHPDRCGSL